MNRYNYAANESLPDYVPAKNIEEVMDRYNLYDIGDSHPSEYEIMEQFEKEHMKRHCLKWDENYAIDVDIMATWTEIDQRFMLWRYRTFEPTDLNWQLPVQLEEPNEPL